MLHHTRGFQPSRLGRGSGAAERAGAHRAAPPQRGPLRRGMDDGLLEVAGRLWIHARGPRPAARAAPTRPDNVSDRTPRSGAAQAVTLVTELPRRSAVRRAF